MSVLSVPVSWVKRTLVNTVRPVSPSPLASCDLRPEFDRPSSIPCCPLALRPIGVTPVVVFGMIGMRPAEMLF